MESELDLTPPEDGETFVEYWNYFMEDIRHRDNLKRSHLQQLKVLCQLYEELNELNDIIKMRGFTYIVLGGRNGDQEKLRPEVQQRNKVRSEIRACSKLLGLVLTKDNTSKEDPSAAEWD